MRKRKMKSVQALIMMAVIANPRKQFNFSIAAPGLNPFLAQKVQVPDLEVNQVEHGDTNFDVKTPGRVKLANITIEKISQSTVSDTWAEDWIETCQSAYLGGAQLPSTVKRTLEIFEYDVDGVTIINSWTCYGCWPCKINGTELNRRGTDNTVTSIELSVDVIKKS